MDATILPVKTSDRAPSSDEAARFRGVFLYVAPAMFLGTLDQTIVAAALPAIVATLGGLANVGWIAGAYLLAATIAAPIYGKLGDAFGRKRALLWALGMFLAGSFACAVAPSFGVLIASRALQGLGGGGLMTLTLALIGEAVSPRERGRFQGWFGAVFALASSLGPIAGGVLAQHAGWRSVFWVNLPLVALAALCAFRVPARRGTGKLSVDVFGTLAFVGSALGLLLCLSLGPQLDWTAPIVLALGCGGLIGFAVLWRIENRFSDPLISPVLIRQPVIWRACACVLLFATLFFGALLQLPLFLQLVFDVHAGLSGLLLIPLTLAQVIVSTATGYRISATGRPRALMAIGLGVSALGFFALAATLAQGPWAICLSSAVFGLGLGTTMPAAQTLVQWAAGNEQLGAATAMVSFARSIGGVLGAAFTSAVLFGVLHVYAPNVLPQIKALLSQSMAEVPTPAVDLVPVELAFRWVFGALGAIGVVGSVLAQSLPDVSLSDPSPRPAAP